MLEIVASRIRQLNLLTGIGMRACGGPGPQTLAYRLVLGVRRSPATTISRRWAQVAVQTPSPSSLVSATLPRPPRQQLDPVMMSRSVSRQANWLYSHQLDRLSRQADKYHRLKEDALDAAAHDEYQGLNHLMLALIKLHRGQEVIDLFNEYLRRMRIVQNKPQHVVFSHDRAERVASRLNGRGLKPLTYAYMAACVTERKIDTAHLLVTLTSNIRLIGNLVADTRDLKSLLLSMPYGQQTFDELLQALWDLNLVKLCWHPVTLKRWITVLEKQNRKNDLIELYNRVMAMSIGPKRIITPVPLGDSAFKFFDEVIPLVADHWDAFLQAFRTAKLPDMVLRLVQVDMPARGVTFDERFACYAMVNLATLSAYPAFDADIRATLSLESERLWDRIRSEFGENSDDALSARIKVLHITKRQGNIDVIHINAQRNGWKNVGPKVIRGLVANYANRAVYDKALEVLSVSLQQDVNHNITKTLAVFYKGLLNVQPDYHANFDSRLSTPEFDRAFWTGLALVKDKVNSLGASARHDQFHSPSTLSRILAYLLFRGNDLEQSVKASLEGFQNSRSSQMIDGWGDYLDGLLRRRAVFHISSKDGLAGLAILDRLVAEKDKIRGVAPRPVLDMWTSYIYHVALTPYISASLRGELLRQAITLFKQFGYEYAPNNLHVHVINTLLSNETAPLDEAWEWYERLKIDVPGRLGPATLAARWLKAFEPRPDLVEQLQLDKDLFYARGRSRSTLFADETEMSDAEDDQPGILDEDE